MKKMVCCLIALLTLLLSAQAEGSLITGEITEGALAGSPVYVLTDGSSLSGTVGSTALLARLEGDTLLAGTDRLAVKLTLPRVRERLSALMARLQEQPTYENAVYSSLFIQAQQIELTADEVAPLAREAIACLPMLDAEGTLLPRLEGAGGQETWATVTRYTADERQYPGTVRDGVLDRRALGRIVFADPEKLALLNRISHRFVKREADRRLRRFAMQGGRIAALDAVELISAGMSERCAATVGILSDENTRIERIMKRDGIGREAARARIDAQKPDAYYQSHCTHILFNNADRERFASDCRRLFKEILNHG